MEDELTVRRLHRVASVALATVLLAGCWLQPGFNGGRTRANTIETRLTVDNAATLRELWSVPVGVPEAVEVSVHEPLVRGGRVYVSFNEVSGYFGRRHGVSALAGTGVPLWNHYGFGTDGAAYSSPATLVGDALYTSWGVAGGGAPCVARFERLDPDDGTVVSSQGVFALGVTHSNDFITFTNRSPCGGGLVLSVRGVDSPQSRFAVSLATRPYPENVVPSAAGDSVFVATGGSLFAYDARGCGSTTCPPMWTKTGLDLDGDVPPVATRTEAGPPRVFVVTESSRELIAVDAATGAVDWHAPLNGSEVADLAVSDSAVFAATGGTGSAAGTVQAFATAGCGQPACDAVWHSAPGTADDSVSPVVAGSALYVGTGSDVGVYPLDGCASSPCDPVTTVSIDDGTEVSHIVVAEGRLFVASPGQLTAFAPDS